MKQIKDYRNKILKSLNYIIHNNSNITSINLDKEYMESLDIHFHENGRRSYIVYVNKKFYSICPYTSIEDAEIILENIDNIKYVYDYDYGTDTLIGNVREFFIEHRISEYKYIQFVLEQVNLFSIEDVITYFKIKKG